MIFTNISKLHLNRLTSPSSNSSFSCLDQRDDEAEAEVLAEDLNDRSVRRMPRTTHVLRSHHHQKKHLLFHFGLVVSITLPNMIRDVLTCQIVSVRAA